MPAQIRAPSAAVPLLAILLGACGGSDEPEDRVHLDLPRYSEDGLRLVHSDLDGDGRPDVIKYFREELDPDTDEVEVTLVRTEIDLNNDGAVNMRRTYAVDGTLVLEEMDGNLDGRMDHTVFWENGVIVRSQTDTNQDGRVDEHREYREGSLNRVMRDTNGNGEIDTWSYYDRGILARVGFDTNGDGEADRWSRLSE